MVFIPQCTVFRTWRRTLNHVAFPENPQRYIFGTKTPKTCDYSIHPGEHCGGRESSIHMRIVEVGGGRQLLSLCFAQQFTLEHWCSPRANLWSGVGAGRSVVRRVQSRLGKNKIGVAGEVDRRVDFTDKGILFSSRFAYSL